VRSRRSRRPDADEQIDWLFHWWDTLDRCLGERQGEVV
jgi:hypothetical protein